MESIYTDKAAFPAGPYSQAIITGPSTPSTRTIYCSGQIPWLADGTLLVLENATTTTPSSSTTPSPTRPGTISDMTQQCFANLRVVLAAGGAMLAHVVKVNVFLVDMADFAEMNAAYEQAFADGGAGTHRPARSCVAVKALPKGVPIEVECVAVV